MDHYDMEISRPVQWVAGFLLLALCAFFLWGLVWAGFVVPTEAWTKSGVLGVCLGVVFGLSLLPLARRLLVGRPATGKWSVIPRWIIGAFSLGLSVAAVVTLVTEGLEGFEQAFSYFAGAMLFLSASGLVRTKEQATR